jgi:hypothetical protein
MKSSLTISLSLISKNVGFSSVVKDVQMEIQSKWSVYKKDANPRQTTAFLTRAKIVKKITRTVT